MDVSSILSKPKSFFGKQKVWMAQGDDLATFNQHRSNIQSLLRHSSIPESTHRLWIGLYRIGTTKAEAKTFVVVSCSDKRIRKLTKDLLSICPIFQPGGALAQFKVISKATPPETSCEPQLTMRSDSETEKTEGSLKDKSESLEEQTKYTAIIETDQIALHMHPSNTGDNFLCRRVQARQLSNGGITRSQSATAGPLICFDSCTYQLTVAHVIDFEEKEIDDAPENTTANYDDWDDDSDGDDASGTSIDEEIAACWNISTRRDMNSEMTHTESGDDDLSDSASSNPSLESIELDNKLNAASGTVHELSESGEVHDVQTIFSYPRTSGLAKILASQAQQNR
ncbi:hypothetical protein IL306_007329 [Fusarium sp. DS 682]|nr:hypothetical protein IL306_007329 [Fusarium sp. DS 682]